MTVNEVKTKFLIELDAVASGAAPGFTDAEISELVDKAQKDLIQQLAIAKKWDDLYTLTRITLSSIETGMYGTKSYYSYLPNDFGYIISCRLPIANRTDISSGAYMASCDEISPDIKSRFLLTPFNAAFFKNPVYFLHKDSDEGEIINFLVDTYTVVNTDGSFENTYVKIPTTFSITGNNNLELPETLHENVVEMAVKEAAKSLTLAKTTNQ